MGRILKTPIVRIPLLAVASTIFAVAAQDAVFRSEVRLVRLLVTVKDRQGAPALDLTKNNFRVWDNGVEQQITVFERHTEQPLSVAILAAMGLGFFLGGLRVWFTAIGHRRAARRAEEAMRLLEARYQELKARPATPTLTHAGAASPG